MASSAFIPDKFTLYGAAGPVWNTDMELDTATYLSTDASFHFLGTSNKAQILLGDMVPCSDGDVEVVQSVVEADDVTAGNAIQIGAFWYDSAKAYIGGSYIFNAVLPSACSGDGHTTPAWFTISGSLTIPSGVGASYVRPVMARAAVGFDAWMDMLGIRKVQPGCVARITGTDAMASGARIIEFDSEVFDYGGNFSTAAHRFTAPMDGYYHIAFRGEMYTAAAPDAGMTWMIQVMVNGGNLDMLVGGDGTEIYNGAVYQWLPTFTYPLALLRGDEVEIWLTHNNTANMQLVNCFFSAIKG